MPANSPARAAIPAARDPDRPYRICLVCLGNICRSPMAEVVVRAELANAGLAGKVEVASAGTGDWHIGQPMDSRARAELARHGHDGSRHRARQIDPPWLARYDLLPAMDGSNLRNLRQLAPDRETAADRIVLFRAFDPAAGPDAEVPDPYDGSGEHFAEVYELVQAAARGLAAALAEQLGDVA
jgi:protein-tyrosine phosphatase